MKTKLLSFLLLGSFLPLLSQMSDPNSMPLLRQEEIPDSMLIGLWVTPPPEFVPNQASADARYKEIKEAGFNFVWGFWHEYANEEMTERVLNACAKNGIVFAPNVPLVDRSYKSISFDRTEVTQFVNKFKNHPGMYGVSLFDEPAPDVYGRVEQLRALVDSLLPPGKRSFCNLFGSGTNNPVEWYEKYAGKVNSKVLSMDIYPLLDFAKGAQCADSKEVRGLLQNLAAMRMVGDSHGGMDLWAFFQACAYDGHRSPTESELYWGMNVHLVFGFKGVSYFLYWLPFVSNTPEGEHFKTSLIDQNGNQTELYQMAKKLNPGVKRLGTLLTAFTHKGVMYINDKIYTHKYIQPEIVLNSFAPIKEASSEGNILMGCFERPGSKALFVLNDDYYKPTTVLLKLENEFRYEVWADGKLEQKQAGSEIDLAFVPGEGKLIIMESFPVGIPSETQNGWTLVSTGTKHRFQFGDTGQKQVEIFSVNGTSVLRTETDGNSFEFDSSTSGVFVAKITKEEKTTSFKLISQ